MQETDYYDILGVSEGADQKRIKESYRRLAFQYHPDRNQDPESVAKMKTINEAYAVLSNPVKRRDYDAMRKQFGSSAYSRFKSTYTENDIFRGSDIHRIFEEMARSFGFRGFDEVFREAYGQGYQRFEFQKPGFFARGYVFSGPLWGKKQAQVPNFPQGNLGKVTRYLLKKMTGVELPENGPDIHEVITLSPADAAEGGPYPYWFRKKSAKLVVKIPPGVREGQFIRLAGMGESGKGGGKPGDLYLRVKIEKPLGQRLKAYFSGLRKGFGLQRR
ncbi:MAG: DnaJ domain-containing protein [Deltaproteobacteria bacterium]|jgi:curved DNA-binding protein CbpA